MTDHVPWLPVLAADALFHVGGYGVRPDDLWVVGTAILCGLASSILGCFLVLRRMSLLGDAISHAILPGLAVAFIVTKSRDPLPMLVGAMLVGVLTAFLSSSLRRWGRVEEGTAMGVVFTTLFAIGVLLISWVAQDVDLDPGCVLYGVIEMTPFDRVVLPLGGEVSRVEIPRAFVGLAIALVVSLAFVLACWKELKIVAFDPALAKALGIGVPLVHYALMTLVAGTTVLSFESVGSILVIALLVAPAATAQLLTDRLGRLVLLASADAVLSSILGYVLAVVFNAPVAGMIATVAGALFVLALALAPRQGLASRWASRVSLNVRIASEDVLGALYRESEKSSAEVTARRPRGVLPWLAVRALLIRGDVRREQGGGLSLSPQGHDRAQRLVRAHRLWETYLSHNLPLPVDHLHDPAERVEHYIGSRLDQALHEETRGATQDPMGKQIPPAHGSER